MKKILFCLCFCFLVYSAAFAQTQRQQPSVTVEEILAILDDNFNKYPWVHQLLSEKVEDTRPARQSITRLPYNVPVIVNGEEKIEKGEVIYVQIISKNYRYDLKFDFSPKQEKGAKRAKTVWNAVRTGTLGELSEYFPKKSEASAD
ncbi:MAG: hypothetical protein LBG79_03160 [Spirochaetaceae bacterium]|jgi:hypothetical protein|nr:hypothetical protein [Spirochaetaceae bacterium]GMO19602.1 MAG: hypothetical protein Pg6A_06330 [Termitinemataceae bacterium]